MLDFPAVLRQDAIQAPARLHGERRPHRHRDGPELAAYAELTGRPSGPFPAEVRFFDLAGVFQHGGGEGRRPGAKVSAR